jgi:GNAT superfamily N-acetyltransferase
MMQVTVRKATAADATALVRLRLLMVTEDNHDSGPDDHAFSESFPAWITEHRSTHLPFLAHVDDDAVGMAWLMVGQRVPSPERRYRRYGDVQSVFVVRELRDRGIGAALIAALLAEAGTLELEHVTVHSSDRAVPFYQRAGFGQDERWLRWQPA